MRENFRAIADRSAKSTWIAQKALRHGICSGEFNPVGSGLWSRGVHLIFCHASPEPLLASMDLIHESTSEGMRPFCIGFGLERIGMERSISIDIATRRGTARWWLR
jgi:hypothetical protein